MRAQTIAIVDYGLGNLASVQRALAAVGHPARIEADPVRLARVDRMILPGVGAFAAGMTHLQERGLAEPILAHIHSGRPFLGICLGQQLLMEISEEMDPDGKKPKGLGVFAGWVRLLPGPDKVPQIGWNSISVRGRHPILSQADGAFVYFVHSYYVEPEDPAVVAAETTYGITFAAGIGRDNVLAVQFHPEKSGAVGLEILRRFCEVG